MKRNLSLDCVADASVFANAEAKSYVERQLIIWPDWQQMKNEQKSDLEIITEHTSTNLGTCNDTDEHIAHDQQHTSDCVKYAL